MALNRKKKFVMLTVFLGSLVLIFQRRLLLNKPAKDDRLKTAVEFSIIHGQRRGNYDKDSLKVVLFYTPLFGRRPWPGLSNDRNFTHWDNIPCRVKSCRITYNRSDFLISDAVLFHGRDLPRVTHMENIAKYKHSKQRWIYFMHESPKFTYYDPSLYNGFFNWTMTYRRDSDFFVPYRFYTRLESEERASRKTGITNYADGKDKLAVWIVSHCGELRDDFVRKLLKYIEIDIFGACSTLFNQTETCPKSSSACSDKLMRYKFLLAFENSFCVDYITEKFWYTAYDHYMIPVVMGAAAYDDPDLSIPGSFINSVDFPSIEALGNYLLFLNSNDRAFNEYFSWRKEFKPVQPESWTCKICAALHNDSLPAKVYDNLDHFWGEEKSCGINEEQIRKLIEQAE